MPIKPIKRMTKAIDPNDPRIQQMKDLMGLAAERERQLVGSRPGFVNELSDEETAQTNQQMSADAKLSPADAAKMDEITAAAQKLDSDKIAVELMEWLIKNVEEYVDNAETIYRIPLTPEQIKTCPEANKVVELFASIPETGHEKEMECITALEEVVARAKEVMKNDDERMAKLFDRLVFFYDTKITMVNGKPLPVTIPMEGKVTLHECLFDTIGQKVTVKRKNVELTREQMQQPNATELVKDAIAKGAYKEVITEIDQPAGYSLELEISYWPKTA